MPEVRGGFAVGTDESDLVLGILRDSADLSEDNRGLLTHVGNVASRRQPCGYFGTFYGLDGSDKTRRCLAPELEGRKDKQMVCPFYDISSDGCCKYKYNER